MQIDELIAKQQTVRDELAKCENEAMRDGALATARAVGYALEDAQAVLEGITELRTNMRWLKNFA